jgi:hypothetical protein
MTNLSEMPVLALMVSATTQIQHYEKGAQRSKNTFTRFDKAPKSPFDQDSIIDLSFDFHDEIEKVLFGKVISAKEIEFKGQLNEEQCKQVYNKILICNTISLRTKIKIYDAFQRDNIKNIKRPK